VLSLDQQERTATGGPVPAMTARQQAVVESRLGRLDAADCRSLVADLWAARGFVTRADGNVVVATRDGTETVIYAVGRRRLGSPPAPDRPVDTVVTVADDHHTPAAVEDGARLLDVTDLRTMLFYAVDRETTTTLCERHLGAPPDQLRPPLRDRVTRRARAVSLQRRTVVTAALVTLVLVGLGAGAIALTDAAGTDTGPDAATSAPESVVTVTATGDSDDLNAARPSTDGVTNESLLPPGVNETGITNLSALGDAHERAVGNGSYTLWLDFYRSGTGEPGGERVQRDMDLAVAGDRYLLRTELENESGHRQPVQTVYHDGDGWYVAEHDNATTSYRRTSSKPTMVASEPSRLDGVLVSSYLSAVETTVTQVDRNGEVRFQITGDGQTSARRSRSVYNYTVTATVTPEGLVRDLALSADIRSRSGSYDARFEVTYGRFGETTVEQPDWVSREFDDDPTTE
jgi:hypothetical protein